jgi:hypothetical protein
MKMDYFLKNAVERMITAVKNIMYLVATVTDASENPMIFVHIVESRFKN